MYSVIPPNSDRLITVPATVAMAIGAKVCTVKWRKTTSSVNSAPAIAALKLADTEAAATQPNRSRPVTPSA